MDIPLSFWKLKDIGLTPSHLFRNWKSCEAETPRVVVEKNVVSAELESGFPDRQSDDTASPATEPRRRGSPNQVSVPVNTLGWLCNAIDDTARTPYLLVIVAFCGSWWG